MAHRFGKIRRFRFNRPQRIAVALLALFLLQGFWLIGHTPLTDSDNRYARCGRETWAGSSALAVDSVPCVNFHDGILAYRIAGMPLSVLDRFRVPEVVVVRVVDAWLMRLPFLIAGALLGGCIWWVTRRLYGNLGGYTSLAFYCFSPAILKTCVTPNSEILSALGVYGGIYTMIGVAHAMQGPRRRWRPRIVMLTVVLGVVASAHMMALAVTLVLGLVFMLWVAEGHRRPVLPVVLLTAAGGLALAFVCYGFSPGGFGRAFAVAAIFSGTSGNPAWKFFAAPANSSVTVAFCAALALYLAARRSRYFGNTTPLLCFAVLMALAISGAAGSPWLWALPFLLTFVGGVFADAYEGRHRRLATGAATALMALQTIFCILSLHGLI